jgi:hypothetical protein
MIPRDDIIRATPIDAYLAKMGHPVVKQGNKTTCRCPFHDDKTPSCSVDLEKQVWFCHACGFGGSVIDLLIRSQGLSVKAALRELALAAGLVDRDADAKPHKVATYEYKDHFGRPVMAVDRIETGLDKKFSQWRPGPNGERINSVSGVSKTLYRLERWAGKAEVALVEGEKCVHELERLGWDATCNPGGSSAWLDAYATYLKDKHVDIWADNDEAGKKWLAAVLKSLEGKVASLRILAAPAPYNDVADIIQAQGDEMAAATILALLGKTPRLARGVNIALLSAQEAYEQYARRVLAMESQAVDLGKWLPSLRCYARPLLPGDLAVFMSDTGVGKTGCLANIAYSQRPLPTIFFELELAPEALCERFIARDNDMETLEVEQRTRQGHRFNVDGWNHVYFCPESKMTLDDMEDIITRAELKMQVRPRLILVDYVGLMSGGGNGKRYERLSTIAEGMKVLARKTETVIIMASQIRRDPDRTEVDLHDAKDSGSVENSAQLVLGAWRPAPDRLTIKILKQTKRAGAHVIHCLFDGHRQKIVELAGNRDNE